MLGGEGWFITCLALLLGQRLSELTLPLDAQAKSGSFLYESFHYLDCLPAKLGGYFPSED